MRQLSISSFNVLLSTLFLSRADVLFMFKSVGRMMMAHSRVINPSQATCGHWSKIINVLFPGFGRGSISHVYISNFFGFPSKSFCRRKNRWCPRIRRRRFMNNRLLEDEGHVSICTKNRRMRPIQRFQWRCI